MRIHIQLLGGFQIAIDGGVPVSIPTRKAQALLAYLAVRPGQRHSRDKIASLLWGDKGEQQARHSLRQTLVALRKTLPANGEFLDVEGAWLSLNREASVDVVDFEGLLGSGELEELEKAVQLYRGNLLDGLTVDQEAFEEWLVIERERYRRLCIDALNRLMQYHCDRNDLDHAIRAGIKLLVHDPLQESVHRDLMRLYRQQGKREAALRQYQICSHLLERELGMEPDAETRDLYREVLHHQGRTDIPASGNGRPEPARRRILLVEDDVVTRALLEGFLKEDGYEVTEASDGADALLRLGKETYDLLLLDLNMPTIDGLKLLEIMGEKGIVLPTICVTAMSGEQFEVKGFKLGAVDYIRKPVNRDVLLMRVRNVLRTHELNIA